MARSLCGSVAAIISPCSVKTCGSLRRPPWPLDLPIWNIKSANSARVGENAFGWYRRLSKVTICDLKTGQPTAACAALRGNLMPQFVTSSLQTPPTAAGRRGHVVPIAPWTSRKASAVTLSPCHLVTLSPCHLVRPAGGTTLIV